MSVYCWGRPDHGELGVKNEDPGGDCMSSKRDCCIPQNLHIGELVSYLAAGDGHTLLATESGDVYACGRGKQGQLGLKVRENKYTPTLVSGLSHESVVRVTASGVSSFAVTATGRVYHWGLVHKSNETQLKLHGTSSKSEDKEKETQTNAYDQVTLGHLTGMADEQSNVFVSVDEEARKETGGVHSVRPDYNRRQLIDIVTDSTERWMLSNDDADAEYYRELQSMGYNKEELDERMQNRGREYHGMLRIQCRRVIVSAPELIGSLEQVKVVSIAAGFAHSIALSDNGIMYSCGYNDRGQLGLGHRISSSEFKEVDYMRGKVVLQVECGQQHSMCRAIDRMCNVGRGTKSNDVVEIGGVLAVGARVGASVYVWGNGMLGQLGLGLKGTSKGRLLPTLLSTFSDAAPLGAVDISAGGNFSVAVSFDGTVFSWGHAEYNQHGSTTMTSGNDYVDNYFYFIPRPMIINNKDGVPEQIASVSCGSNFTVAVSETGDAYSWGWNSYGVLGHGRGYFGQEVLKITALGKAQIDKTVKHVCSGSNHVLAITSSSGNSWAKNLQHLLPQSSTFRCRSANDYSDMEVIDESTGTLFPCHRVVLAARSPYFAGYLKVADRMRKLRVSTESEIFVDGDNSNPPLEQMFLDCPAANVLTIQYLLEYIYTDTLSAPIHKRRQLAELADFVSLPRLSALCRRHGFYVDHTLEDIPLSSFEQEMDAMVKNEMFSDCKFILNDLPFKIKDDFNASILPEPIVFHGHKVFFEIMPYFQSLFSGEFSDGTMEPNGTMTYDMAGFIEDGIGSDTFERLVRYAYTGATSVLDVDDSCDLMGLLLAANRVNLSQLAQLCEKKLSLHLKDFPENVENCLHFAHMYNIPRLLRQCEELMVLSSCTT